MNKPNFARILTHIPTAAAVINGDDAHSDIHGVVKFYETGRGVLVATEIDGLPVSAGFCRNPIFAFHIHGGESCTGTPNDPFANAQTHYNPHGCPHPYHAGDLQPLFAADGMAFSVFLTDRFTVEEIMGKTVIIREMPDDFTTQPSGNAGKKIACGEIRPVRR